MLRPKTLYFFSMCYSFKSCGDPMFSVSTGPSSKQLKENGSNQKIQLTSVSINLCCRFTLQKSHIFTRSTALLTHAHFSKHLILSSTPLHNLLLTISLTADDFAYYFTYKTTTISSQFSASHIQELKPATLTDKNLLSSLSSLSDEELYLLSQMKNCIFSLR